MNNLPAEISLEIFSRTPADAVLECQRVCKTWRDLISQDKAKFYSMHFARLNDHQHGVGSSKVSTHQGLIFLILSATPRIPCYPLYYGELDEKNSTDQKKQCIQDTLRSIKKYSSTYLIGSCNGLICFVETRNHGGLGLHICNPVTRESLNLDGYDEDIECYDQQYTGFGYSSQTNEYKIVKISYRYRIGHIEVYTLGSGSGWRYKGEITVTLGSHSRGVFFNGALHWLREREDIRVFNLSDEKFHVIPVETFPNFSYRFTCILESFVEWLCVISCDKCSQCLDIWTYKKTLLGKSTAGTNNMDESWSWCKEFSIRLENSFAMQYRPFVVTKSGLVLLEKNVLPNDTKELCCYDPKTGTMKRHGIWNSFNVIPHTNSFVSLEDLGETTCKKRKKRSS